jgi:hypothetical protein
MSLTRQTGDLGPSVLSMKLTPVGAIASSESNPGANSAAPPPNGTLKIVVKDDDSFEYQLTISNRARRAFGGAYVYHRIASPDSVVMTLFSGETLAGRYIQLRGTGVVPRAINAHALAQSLRASPADYVFRVEARGRQGLALQGTTR